MDEFIKKAEENNLIYKTYPNGLINITDTDGVIQSYYTTKGTAIFRDGNDKYKSNKHIEKNMPYERFLALCKGDEDILETFFD